MSAHAGTHTRASDQGPIAEVCADDVLAALRLARTGRVYDLEVERFRGMPLHPAHPQMAGLYRDTERMAEHAGPGIDSSAARWLVDKGVVCAVGDTETLEQIPCADPNNPHAVHTILLAESGVHIAEMANMEELSADQVYEFAFIALPCRIRGATGSMIRPIAIV